MNAWWLTSLVCLASLHKPARFILVVTILAIQWLHFRWFDDAPSALVYYGTAALFDALIVGLLSRCRGAMAADLLLINAAAVCIHATGWLAYEAYLPPTAYNAAIQALFFAQMARMLWHGGEDDDRGMAATTDRHLLVRWADSLRPGTSMGKGQ